MTLYLFFEALGLVAFLLVIHTETDEAKAAAIKYFWMTVVGGFALIGGIFLTFALGGTGVIGPVPASEGRRRFAGPRRGLLVLGFGVKAACCRSTSGCPTRTRWRRRPRARCSPV